jgi:hypothetical protein
MSQNPVVPIPERGGKSYQFGTVYYSRTDKAFYAAGRENEGPLSVGQVSSRVTYFTSSNGVARFRDETGVFIPTGVFRASAGTKFGSQFLNVTEAKARPEIGTPSGPDAQFVERFTLLMPDGKVKVVEVNHGIDGEYDPQRQSKQWWRKMREAIEEETGEKPTYNEVLGVIQSREVIARFNLGPAAQGI